MYAQRGRRAPKTGHIRGRVGDGGSDTRTLSGENEEDAQEARNLGTTFLEAAV